MIRAEAIDLARSIVEAVSRGERLTFGDKDKTFAEVCSVLLSMAPVVEAAEAWRDAVDGDDGDAVLARAIELTEAVDALRKAPRGGAG